jgi:hypothetical protein
MTEGIEVSPDDYGTKAWLIPMPINLCNGYIGALQANLREGVGVGANCEKDHGQKRSDPPRQR